MSRQKCTACGLVNFAGQESCKRCKTPLRNLHNERETTPEERRAKLNEAYAHVIDDPPSLGTVNGIGTRLLGWRHHEDGTATATVWLTVLFLPLFPMGRWRLVSPTKDDFEPTFSLQQLLTIFSSNKSVTTEYAFVEWLKISGREVLFTYAYAYLWLPFKLFLPLWLFLHFAPTPDKNDGSMTSALIFGSSTMIWTGYLLVVLTRLLHQTRGGR